MAGAIVEVRCPNGDIQGVSRAHGVGWLIAAILSFVGVGIPFFVYMTWRPNRLGDRMKCSLCKATFRLDRQHVTFPYGTGAGSSSQDADVGAATSSILWVVVALSGAVGLGAEP
jgi:hypothetical protein